jgi:hypothetical protein
VLLAGLIVGGVITTALVRVIVPAWWHRHDRKTAERIDARTSRLRALAARRDALEKLYDLPPVEPRR